MANDGTEVVGDDPGGSAPRRVDAAWVPGTRGWGHGDVGTPNPESHSALNSQERARAGMESIRSADAAVEAARETARARASERVRARAEAERYAAAADALALETKALVHDDFAPLVGDSSRDDSREDRRPGDGDGGSAVDTESLTSRRLDNTLQMHHTFQLNQGVEVTDTRSTRARWSHGEKRDSVEVLTDVHEKHIRNASLSPEPRPFVDKEVRQARGVKSDKLDDVTSGETNGGGVYHGFEERTRNERARIRTSERSRERSETREVLRSTEFLSRPASAHRARQKTPPSTPPRLVPHTSHDEDTKRKPPVPNFNTNVMTGRVTPVKNKVAKTPKSSARKPKSSSVSENIQQPTVNQDPSRTPIAFVGVTATGAALCARLLDYGYPVVVAPCSFEQGFTSTREEEKRASTLAKHGATLAKSPRHAVELLVLGKVETSGPCNGFLPKAWAPGLRCKDRRDAAKRHDGDAQPTPVLILRAGEEDEDETGMGKQSSRDRSAQDRLRSLDALTTQTLEDIFHPHSQKATSENRQTFGGSLLVLNLNSSTRAGVLKNCDRLTNQMGISFVQAATRGDAFDAEDGAMRIAIAALDVVSFERQREKLRKKNGQSTVPVTKPTGALCSSSNRNTVGALSELNLILSSFARKEDLLLFRGKHPVEAAVMGGDFREYHGDSRYEEPYEESEDESVTEYLGVRDGDANGSFADGVSDDDNHKVIHSGRRSSPTSGSTWRRADARATARAKQRHEIANAPVTAKLQELESVLTQTRTHFSHTETNLRGQISDLETKCDALKGERDEAVALQNRETSVRLEFETRNKQLLGQIESVKVQSRASETDAAQSAERYEATERELGEALISLQDLRLEHSREVERLQNELLTQADKVASSFAALVVERDALEVTLKRRELETNAAADAFSKRDEAEKKQRVAETIAAAAVAEKDVASKAAVETIATLRVRVKNFEEEHAVASGREASAVAALEAANEEVNAMRRVVASTKKECSEKIEQAKNVEIGSKQKLEDKTAELEASEASVVALEKAHDDARRTALTQRKEASTREKSLIAERDVLKAEIAGAKAATRKLLKENDKLATVLTSIKENGGVVDTGDISAGDTNTPWRPPGPSPGKASTAKSAFAKKVSLDGLLKQTSPGGPHSTHSTPTKGDTIRSLSGTTGKSTTSSVSSSKLVAKLEAAERTVASLASSLTNSETDLSKENDLISEKLEKVLKEKTRLTGEVARLKTALNSQKTLAEHRGAKRGEACGKYEALRVTHSATLGELSELNTHRKTSEKVAERYILDVATNEKKIVLLRDENFALLNELSEIQSRFGVLGGLEATARKEREQAERYVESVGFEKDALRLELRETKDALDALHVEHKLTQLELVGFKNGAAARQADLKTKRLLKENDEKHEAQVGLLLAEAAFEKATAESATQLRDIELRKESAAEHAVVDAVVAAARAREISLEVQFELERANSPLGHVTHASKRGRERHITPIAKQSLTTRAPPLARTQNPTYASPMIATPRVLLLEQLRVCNSELVTMTSTRAALELALETPEVLHALEALKFGDADPSPACAMACHLAICVVRASGNANDQMYVTEETIAASVLGDAFAIRTPTRGINGGASSLSPSSIRAALGLCFEESSDAETQLAAANRFADAFHAIRPDLGKTLLNMMRQCTFDTRNPEGLETATNAVRVLMMRGGFDGLDGDEAETDAVDTGVPGAQTSGDPLAECLFRWSACAVREWRLRVRIHGSETELQRVEERENAARESSDDEFENSDAFKTVSLRKSKGRRSPLVVRAPQSPEDARKIARHGTARVLTRGRANGSA